VQTSEEPEKKKKTRGGGLFLEGDKGHTGGKVRRKFERPGRPGGSIE